MPTTPAAAPNGQAPAAAPDVPPRPAVLDRRLWREALACLWPHRWAALLTALAIVAGAVLNLTPPLLVRGLIDDAIPAGRASGSAEPLLPYVLGLVLLPLAAGLVGLGQQYLSVQIGQGVLADLRIRLFRRLQGQSLRFFTTTRAGEITSRVSDVALAWPPAPPCRSSCCRPAASAAGGDRDGSRIRVKSPRPSPLFLSIFPPAMLPVDCRIYNFRGVKFPPCPEAHRMVHSSFARVPATLRCVMAKLHPPRPVRKQ